MAEREDRERLAALRRARREALAEGFSRVSRLEEPAESLEAVEKFVEGEIARYGGRRVDFESE